MRVILESGNVVKVANTMEQAAKFIGKGFHIKEILNGQVGSTPSEKVPEAMPQADRLLEEAPLEDSSQADQTGKIPGGESDFPAGKTSDAALEKTTEVIQSTEVPKEPLPAASDQAETPHQTGKTSGGEAGSAEGKTPEPAKSGRTRRASE